MAFELSCNIDDDLSDNAERVIESRRVNKNLSNSNQNSASVNAPPPKPIRYSKIDKGALNKTETHLSLNEFYAKRPLPPIPNTHDRHGGNGDIELPANSPVMAATASARSHQQRPTRLLEERRQLPQPPQDDDTNDSSSEEESEDSPDNRQNRPKPGKLDLSQFDNITNAIGKLNVHPPRKPSTSSSSFNEAVNRTNSKGAQKKAPHVANHTPASAKIASPVSMVSSVMSSVPAASASFGNTRTAISSSSSGAKRLGNPRHKQGRAVAPPQLPGDVLTGTSGVSLRSGDTESSQTGHDSNQLKQQDVSNHLSGEIDYSHSPIAQRLLRQSKDYKVSELCSPYDSDADQYSPNLINQQFQRHQKIFEQRKQSLDNCDYTSQNLDHSGTSPGSIFAKSSIDSSELMSSREAAIKQLNEILANKRPPGRPGGSTTQLGRGPSLDLERQQQSTSQQTVKKSDKDIKKEKKKLRDDEKLEKRRLKEEERLRSKEKKLAKKSKSITPAQIPVGDDGVPLFIRRCIEFIEAEGLDAEGIYRVPGNRAHVDAFFQKFKDNPDMSIADCDIPVNAVATALKDFLSKKCSPIIPTALMSDLTELSNISEKEKRVLAVKQLIHKLPPSNYNLLRYVLSHFVKVSHNHSLNSMDSKNLAICWWPTLLPVTFSDMVMFEQMRPHLEESIQSMIDQYDFIFDQDEPSFKTVHPLGAIRK